MRGLLITGEYGAGKTAVAAEITHLLAEQGVPSAGIDLDWLCWVGPDLDPVELWRVKMGNLRAMVTNFATVGVESLVIAGALFDMGEREMVAAAVEPADLQVVRLEVPSDLARDRIRRRDVGRELAELLQDSTAVARAVHSAGVEDFSVPNHDGWPIEGVAREVLAAVGWSS